MIKTAIKKKTKAVTSRLMGAAGGSGGTTFSALLLFFALVSVFFAAAVFFFEEFVLCAIDSDPFSAQKIAVRMMESTPTTQQ